jgi:hypothetical protein
VSRCTPAPRPRKKEQCFHALRFRGQLEPPTETRRRRISHSRVGEPAHQPVEVRDDFRAEAPCDALHGQVEHVAHPQHAQIRQSREGFLGPVEQEERKVGNAFAKVAQREAGAHLQAVRFDTCEEARGKRGGRDA